MLLQRLLTEITNNWRVFALNYSKALHWSNQDVLYWHCLPICICDFILFVMQAKWTTCARQNSLDWIESILRCSLVEWSVGLKTIGHHRTDHRTPEMTGWPTTNVRSA